MCHSRRSCWIEALKVWIEKKLGDMRCSQDRCHRLRHAHCVPKVKKTQWRIRVDSRTNRPRCRKSPLNVAYIRSISKYQIHLNTATKKKTCDVDRGRFYFFKFGSGKKNNSLFSHTMIVMVMILLPLSLPLFLLSSSSLFLTCRQIKTRGKR